jgi:regulator of sigma D
MLWNFKNSQSKIEHTINAWVNEGQELLVLFYKINDMQPFTEDCLETKAEVLQDFHQTLTDYLGCGHLEVFQALIKENAKFSVKNIALDAVIIEQLHTNKDRTMDLITNEKGGKTSWKILKNNLNQLGELIAERIELETVLLKQYSEGKSNQNYKSLSDNSSQSPV